MLIKDPSSAWGCDTSGNVPPCRMALRRTCRCTEFHCVKKQICVTRPQCVKIHFIIAFYLCLYINNSHPTHLLAERHAACSSFSSLGPVSLCPRCTSALGLLCNPKYSNQYRFNNPVPLIEAKVPYWGCAYIFWFDKRVPKDVTALMSQRLAAANMLHWILWYFSNLIHFLIFLIYLQFSLHVSDRLVHHQENQITRAASGPFPSFLAISCVAVGAN